jgi:hypothetical protein
MYGTTIFARAHGLDEIKGDLYRLGATSTGDFEFMTIDGVVEGVRASFTTTSFPAVVAAVKAKYGEPTETKNEEVRTRAGGKFPNTVMIWKEPEGELRVRERAGRIDTMELSISTSKLQAKLVDEYKRQIEKGAKDL